MRNQSVIWEEKALEETLERASVKASCRLRKLMKMGAWLTLNPITVNGTEVGVQEWQNVLFLMYGLDPPDLPKFCDGCNSTF